MRNHNGRGELLMVFDMAKTLNVPSWPVKVFDIGEDKFVGVLYPDKAWQEQPRLWWEERLRKAPPLTPEQIAEYRKPEVDEGPLPRVVRKKIIPKRAAEPPPQRKKIIKKHRRAV